MFAIFRPFFWKHKLTIGSRWVFDDDGDKDPFKKIDWGKVTIIERKKGYVKYERDGTTSFLKYDSMGTGMFLFCYKPLDCFKQIQVRKF